jgi:hypothetical protein
LGLKVLDAGWQRECQSHRSAAMRQPSGTSGDRESRAGLSMT